MNCSPFARRALAEAEALHRVDVDVGRHLHVPVIGRDRDVGDVPTVTPRNLTGEPTSSPCTDSSK